MTPATPDSGAQYQAARITFATMLDRGQEEPTPSVLDIHAAALAGVLGMSGVDDELAAVAELDRDHIGGMVRGGAMPDSTRPRSR